jgi:hypothetical protein
MGIADDIPQHPWKAHLLPGRLAVDLRLRVTAS